jgi:hypothetical protein
MASMDSSEGHDKKIITAREWIGFDRCEDLRAHVIEASLRRLALLTSSLIRP